MSQNITNYQRERLPVTALNQVGQAQAQRRTLQPQGSQAIRVALITGYQYFAIPSNTVPYCAYIDLVSNNPDDLVIATLARTTFMGYTNGSFVNADIEEHGLGDDVWDVWLAYDRRPTPDTLTVSGSPGATLTQRIVADVAAYAMPLNQARIGIRVNRLEPFKGTPANLSQYVVIYQIRVVIGGA